MSLAALKVHKDLQLENEELKHLLLKLTAKYKTSEIKRNVLLKRNAMLINDNKNLHIQLIETTKSKAASDKSVATYQEALKLLKQELKELKAETLSKSEHMDNTKSIAKQVASCSLPSGKPVQQKEESEQYFEVSDLSIRGARSGSFKSYDSPPRSSAGTYMSDDAVSEAEPPSPSNGSQKEEYVICSEVEAYYQIPTQNSQSNRGEFTDDVSSNLPATESLMSDDSKIEEKDPFTQKRDRLWAQIKELREMAKVTDEELQTRRFAVAAKAEMIQNVHKEIKRMQTLISLAK